MKEYKFTFGIGKEKVVVTSNGSSILDALERLRFAGWEINKVTSVILIKK